MDKSLLCSIICLCEENGANVRGIVCDMGNSKLLKELDVYRDKKHFFENPCKKERKVYIFPDVPHCLKNLRNHCLDYDLCIKNSDGSMTVISKETFEKLIVDDHNDFKLCPKISLLHVNCSGNERQRVKYAVQLFSNTVGKALEFKYGESCSDQAKVICLIDAWFDVMDSRSKFHWKNNVDWAFTKKNKWVS